MRAAAIRDQSPGRCYDIDTLDDYRYACGARNAAPARIAALWFGIQSVWSALLGVGLQGRVVELAPQSGSPSTRGSRRAERSWRRSCSSRPDSHPIRRGARRRPRRIYSAGVGSPRSR